MSYNYNPLWKTLEHKNCTTYFLINHGVNPRTINKLKHNQNINVETLDLLCSILECSIQDILEIKPSEHDAFKETGAARQSETKKEL